MKKILLCLTVLLFSGGAALAGAGLSEKDAKAIKDASLSIYPGAVVIPGERAMGVGFATSDGVDKVRQWYRERKPGWATFDDGGMWITYDGKPGLNPFEIMSKTQVMVKRNGNLPLVHRFEKDMTTEIIIVVP